MPRYSKKYAYLIAALILLLIFHYTGITSTLESAISGSFGSLFGNIRRATSEEIATTNLAEVRWHAEAQRLEQENEQLKKIISFQAKTNYRQVSTRVISRDFVSSEQILVLDAGSNEGLEVGQPVIAADGVMVGKIIKTNEHLAWLRLLNDGSSQVAAKILSRDKSIGVVEGGYGLSVKMNYIPRNETVAVGDIVVTSGWEMTVPAGLVLGQVVAIENESYKPFQQAVISPLVNLEKLSIVSVLIRTK